jgi:hypothetical protein
MTFAQKAGLFWGYAAFGAVTLPFQIFVRLQQCTDMGGCLLSVAKGIVWSVLWTANWVLYVAGLQ